MFNILNPEDLTLTKPCGFLYVNLQGINLHLKRDLKSIALSLHLQPLILHLQRFTSQKLFIGMRLTQLSKQYSNAVFFKFIKAPIWLKSRPCLSKCCVQGSLLFYYFLISHETKYHLSSLTEYLCLPIYFYR